MIVHLILNLFKKVQIVRLNSYCLSKVEEQFFGAVISSVGTEKSHLNEKTFNFQFWHLVEHC